MTKLIDEATIALIAGGWSLDRTYDIYQYEDYYIKNGYVINDVIRKALRSFGGLNFKIPTFTSDDRDTAHFDIIKAVNHFCFRDTSVFEPYTNGPVLPIGECYSGDIVTLMSYSGRVYGIYGSLYYLGEDICDYINALYKQRHWQKIDIPEMDQS